MNEFNNPKQVHPPLSAYSHTVKVPPNATWLILSGQVGINASGKLQTGMRRQAEQVFRNILERLRANRGCPHRHHDREFRVEGAVCQAAGSTVSRIPTCASG